MSSPAKHHFRASATIVANPPSADHQKTVVVLGAFRGGTSMVAQVLRDLGIFMGDQFAASDIEYDNLEDQEFQSILHRRDLLTQYQILPSDFSADEIQKLKSLIERRNRDHALWGWKYPATVIWTLYAQLARYLRNPHFITVFRDPLAIFQHELDKQSIKPDRLRTDKGRSFAWVGLQNQRLVDNVTRLDSPHLLISYERTMTGGDTAKRALVETLIQFLSPALKAPPLDSALRTLDYRQCEAVSESFPDR